jgi:glycosyltransferase involved in cell wall biosynthesis
MTNIALTIGMAVYGQPEMLRVWFDRFQAAGGPRDDVEVIVVDDCGDPPATPPVLPNVRALRITIDHPWNQMEARNLAATEARGRVLLLLDPDMTLPPKSLAEYVHVAKAMNPLSVQRPLLRHGDGTLDNHSPNVFLIHRADFLAVSGYDTRFRGAKGYSDCLLKDVLSKLYRQRHAGGLVLDFHHNKLIPDAQVTKLSRDYSRNRKLYHDLLPRLRKMGVDAFLREHPPMVDSPWEEVRCPTG